MNEVTFTVQHYNDCPKSISWKFTEHGRVYACTAKSKYSGNSTIDIIKDFTSIPNWCPLLNKKNYIKNASGEIL